MASDNAVVQAVTMNRYGTAFLRENAASKVLDVGCTGFRVLHTARALGMTDMRHFGVDYSIAEEEIPNGVEFRHCDLNKERIPFEDDMFDLVVASHVYGTRKRIFPFVFRRSYTSIASLDATISGPAGSVLLLCTGNRSLQHECERQVRGHFDVPLRTFISQRRLCRMWIVEIGGM